MAYIGNIPAESYASFETETFSVSATGSILVVPEDPEQATTPVRMSAAPIWEIAFFFIMTPCF